MSSALPKGVFDIFPYVTSPKNLWRNSALWKSVEHAAHRVCNLYGFDEIRTPVFEKTETFLRVGEHSDIVKKEVYTFLDKKGRSLTLRPEGTAAVVRALLDHSADMRKDNKIYYILPMFRYERQQSGRYRQHHQFGLEAIGVRHPLRDVEVLSLLWDFYAAVGLKHMQIQVNFLGGQKTRARYDEALRDFFRKDLDRLSPLSQERYHANLLRILDSKEPEDQEFIEKAPSILDYVEDKDLRYFDAVLAELKVLDIPYKINPRLVRGLDYYTDLVFEAVTVVGDHSYALGGGGRYDELVMQSGGPSMPAFGFGVGLERVIQTLLEQETFLPTFTQRLRLVPLDERADSFCFSWAKRLRHLGVATEVDWSHKKPKAALKDAADHLVGFVCLVGEQELSREQFIVKDMSLHQSFSGAKQDVEQRLVYEVQNA
ncbi:histidine--tRNA ligase [Chlamydia suis]|uniref:Histidine--tRNA ligase n=1 Tax=Chlamydia suis TaxID=83559 RepID=A0AAQ0J6F9_9CHLA|nr:histidine--tRNA ligase [Chlamydia suis]MEB2681362.1 histidine--tRNA ligase [Chlamydia suis]MEB2681768.1 histidine--tRNA ligase [Chlamydia suis]MEB2682689.1 histidine--tRNA ligase [Chlamydia suis]MEB2684069.1 histidine--tRNA ligase [Chlamydia suis]MEB2684504.1 histidine--tRNA ligase [Chlamydia suis]